MWSEYANLSSQFSGNTGLEQEKAELQDQWRGQQSKLQRRGSSLGAALRQIDSTENHMVDFTDRLDRYLRQPKDITAFTLTNTNILKDIKVRCLPWMSVFVIYLGLSVDLRFTKSTYSGIYYYITKMQLYVVILKYVIFTKTLQHHFQYTEGRR